MCVCVGVMYLCVCVCTGGMYLCVCVGGFILKAVFLGDPVMNVPPSNVHSVILSFIFSF